MKSFTPFAKFNNNSGQTLKLIPLGGVGDVTKNMYVYEFGNDIIIVDCGVGFPDEDMPGVDLVIPDISYLRDKKQKIRGIIITHGHDDHIGGLPFLWPELDCPIYTQKLTAGFIRSKFTEHNLPKNKIFELKFDDKLKLGVFELSFYLVSHSIPDSQGIVIKTPVGTIIHQADFKIDWTPVSGQVTDVAKVAQVSAEGVRLLLIDCLRIEKPGFNKSEKSIEDTFEKASVDTPGKLLITMTSSNISRMQQAINVAQRTGRKVALAGRSFENCFQVARDLGYLDVPAGIIVAFDAMSTFPAKKLLILIAGSQGQPGSALDRAANGEHKQIKLQEGDGVVFSADPIPSTEASQSALIDSLTKLGVEVYYSAITSDLHVSGHAALEEIRLMLNLIKAQYLLGIGGTYRHMKMLSNVAQDMGYEKKNILDVVDGDTILIDKNEIKIGERIEVQNVYVDGYGVGDVGKIMIQDRQQMSKEGIVIVVVPIDKTSGKIVGHIDMISKGFIFEQNEQDLLNEARQLVSQINDTKSMGKLIEEKLSLFFYKATERRPLILPIVVES